MKERSLLNNPDKIPWKYVVITVFVGLFLIFGYFVAARLHFQSLDLGISVAQSKKKIDLLLAERQKLSEISKINQSSNIINSNLQIRIDEQLLLVEKSITFYSDYIKDNEESSLKYDNYARALVVFLLALTVITIVYLVILSQVDKVKRPIHFRFFSMSSFLFSKENLKEVFDPIIADWQEEYFEALFKKEIWKARWINVRYTYAFLAAMWQKSPIGDLIEFFNKIAK